MKPMAPFRNAFSVFANGPIPECVQRVCYDTLPWRISVSLAD